MKHHVFAIGDHALYFGQPVRVDDVRNGLLLITYLDENGRDVMTLDGQPEYVGAGTLRAVVTLNRDALDSGAVVG
jgi:hypothetical protein